ncbi:MAG: IPT/TIG domain-containing protein [Bacteroidota bacterium]|jgi:hypothetical protein
MKTMHLIFCLLILTLFFLCACNHFDAPTEVWDPNRPLPTGPYISNVIPANIAVAGVREITIIGHNFSTNLDSFFVNFGLQPLPIKKISISAAMDTIVISRPAIFGFNNISIMFPAADSIAKYPYTIENPITRDAVVSNIFSGNLLVMEADKGDTIWIGNMPNSGTKLGYIYKLLPDGVTMTVFKDTSYLKPRINNKASDFTFPFADLKVGPGGFLYATFVLPSTASASSIYCMNPNSSAPVVYATLSANNAAKFDFDDNKNIYTGKNNGLFLVKPDGTNSSVGDYTGSITFGEIRVIKNANNDKFVYALIGAAAARPTFTQLYKSPINNDGTVGNKQLVYNITADTAFSGCTISSLNVKSDGTVLLSLYTNSAVNGNQNYSLFVLENNGSLTPYYKDNTILPTGIDQLIWGSGRYLYLSRGKTDISSTRFFRMGMEQNGVPYPGRNL